MCGDSSADPEHRSVFARFTVTLGVFLGLKGIFLTFKHTRHRARWVARASQSSKISRNELKNRYCSGLSCGVSVVQNGLINPNNDYIIHFRDRSVNSW